MGAEGGAAATRDAVQAGKIGIKTGSAAGSDAVLGKNGLLAWKGPHGTSVGTRDGQGSVVAMIQTTVAVVAGVVERAESEGEGAVVRWASPSVG